jgi:isocitrate dehydrogenase kinase/phosphatase
MLLQRLDSAVAADIAKAMMDGFNRHYRLFRAESARAKHRFETADWHGQQRATKERIEFYDLRVKECSKRLEAEFKAGSLPMDVWQQVKLLYIGMLVDHKQPELAESFFNSVTTKILDRTYFQNDFIFVRPAVSTEYIESEDASQPSTYRSYYPKKDDLLTEVRQLVADFALHVPFENLERDTLDVCNGLKPLYDHKRLRANFQVQVLSSLFYRNKGAYVVGKLINGFREVPFALPILHNAQGKLVIDALLTGEDELLILFSFARAYFMVDMAVPSAYVQFLRSMMPRKPRAEFYNALGLAKQGKTLFYRDLPVSPAAQHRQVPHRPRHQGHGDAGVRSAQLPVMCSRSSRTFTRRPKTPRASRFKGKYLLVKQHDRVGRMADTLEYSERGLPARPLRARADGRNAEICAQPAGNLGPRWRWQHRSHHQARVHRAAHDPAQHLPAGSVCV